MRRTGRRAGLAGAAVAVVLAAAAVPASGAAGQSTRGSFAQVAGPQSAGMGGHAHLVRTGSGRTLLSVHVSGLTPGGVYGVHLHGQSCTDNVGGGHYRDNTTSGVPVPPNELWASSDPASPQAGVRANAAGVAAGFGRATWRARSEARSVVVHAPGSTAGGTKLLCADLR